MTGVDVDIRIEILEDPEYEVTEIEGAHFVESHEGYVFLERWLVEKKNYLFNFLRLNCFLLHERQTLILALHSKIYLNYQTTTK